MIDMGSGGMEPMPSEVIVMAFLRSFLNEVCSWAKAFQEKSECRELRPSPRHFAVFHEQSENEATHRTEHCDGVHHRALAGRPARQFLHLHRLQPGSKT